MRSAAVRLGLLTNGIQLTAWRLESADHLRKIIDIDLPTTITAWRRTGLSSFPQYLENSLQELFNLYRKETFTDPGRLEKEIATDVEEWAEQALPLDRESNHQSTLVEALQSLIKDLQMDAHRTLEQHLIRYTEFTKKVYRFSDDAPEPASHQMKLWRQRIISVLRDSFQLVWGLETEDIAAIEDVLV